MNIKVNITEDQKKQLSRFLAEGQVLSTLLTERQAMLGGKVREILTSNALSPTLYVLQFNPKENLWEAKPKQEKLILPKKEVIRASKAPGKQN